MSIAYFVMIVTVAAFCGGLAGSLITCAAYQGKRPKRRQTAAENRRAAKRIKMPPLQEGIQW